MDVDTSWTNDPGVLTYPSPNLRDYTLDENVSERNLPLDNGRHILDPKFDLGVLETLPLEILQQILVQIDLRCLTDFRGVNQRAMQVVDSIPQYQSIFKHCLVSLRCVLAIETGKLISCQRLYRTLITATCEACDDFAGFIYLLTCSRVCFLCISEEIKYLPLPVMEVKRRFGVPRSIVVGLPGLKSVPGCYSPNERLCPSRLTLYDYESARHVAETYHGSEAAMQQHVDSASSNRLRAYQSRVLKRSNEKEGPIPRRPPRIISHDGKASNPKRFMAVVRAPWLDLCTRREEWGFHCVGCQEQYRARPLHWRRKYSLSTFLDHIRECGQISGGRHSS